MSTFRRRLLMMAATSKSQLPAGWKEVEYVYFDKALAQYIDTGIVPDPNTKVEVIVSGVHNDFSHDRFFGVSEQFMIGFMSGTFVFWYNNKSATATDNYTAGGGNTYIRMTKDGIHNHVTILKPTGDVEVEVPDNLEGSFTTTKTMWVGRANDLTGWAIHNNRIKSLKIWQSGEPVRDFIPVSDGAQEALYDRVTETLFYKQTP